MNFWICGKMDSLRATMKLLDVLILNDAEAREMTREANLIRAARAIIRMGPKIVVIKKGEHGAMFFSEHETYVLPAFPTERVVDPTGAGDSFAGGMKGYLAERGEFSPRVLKEALAYGTVVASYNVEDFSLDRMKSIERPDLDQRWHEYRRMLSF